MGRARRYPSIVLRAPNRARRQRAKELLDAALPPASWKAGRAFPREFLEELRRRGLSRRLLVRLQRRVRVRFRDRATLQRAVAVLRAEGFRLSREAHTYGSTCRPEGATLATLPVHRAAAPLGVGAAALRTALGPEDAVGFADVEFGWDLAFDRQRLRHDALEHLPLTELVQPSPLGDSDAAAHGTMVLGVVLARRDDEAGFEGVARHVSSLYLARPERFLGEDSLDGPAIVDPDPEWAILYVAAKLEPGGVLLVEFAPDEGRGFPESDEAVHDAILAATEMGVTVVAAAGNGGVCLDHLAELADEDSGAVVVAAATRGPDGGWRRPEGADGAILASNYGRRVDCFAGADVLTTQVVGGRSTHGCLQDTSAAAAVVAGAALVTQGLARRHLGRVLHPRELRWLFRTYGTPGAPGIGRMPDLARIERWMLGPPDVALRDTPLDDGTPHPGVGPTFDSPDILLFAAPPDAAVFEQDGLAAPGLRPGEGATVAYVRVHDRGEEPAQDIVVDLFHAAPTTLPLRGRWASLGQRKTPIAKGARFTTFGPFPVGVDGPGCFVAVARAVGDEAPPLDHLAGIDAHAWHVQASNNLAWRCGGAVAPTFTPEGTVYELTCDVRGASDRPARFELEARFHLPPTARVTARFPAWLAGELQLPLPDGAQAIDLPLHARVADWCLLGAGTFSQQPDAVRFGLLTVRVVLPPGAVLGERRAVALRQRLDGVDVGRFTWWLTDP